MKNYESTIRPPGYRCIIDDVPKSPKCVSGDRTGYFTKVSDTFIGSVPLTKDEVIYAGLSLTDINGYKIGDL